MRGSNYLRTTLFHGGISMRTLASESDPLLSGTAFKFCRFTQLSAFTEGATCSLFRTRNFFTAAKLAGQLFAKFGGSQKVAILRGFCKHQNRRPFILLK